MTKRLKVRRLDSDSPPSTICPPFVDVNGTWNRGFLCSIQNQIQFFCCGTEHQRYCCSSDRYMFEHAISTKNSSHFIDFTTNPTHLAMVAKRFDTFQRYFLPIFLLTTTILFLVGIAFWFWLYKHKQFYSLGNDDSIEMTLPKKQRDSMNYNHNVTIYQENST